MKTYVFIIAGLLHILSLSGEDSLKVGFSLGEYTSERWIADKEYFEKEANARGISVDFALGFGDVKEQTKQCKELVDKGIQLLFIVPIDGDKCNEIVEYAHQRNVKVICYDRLIKGASVDYYISFDAVRVGELQAKYMVQKCPKGNYVLLAGPKTDNNAILFLEGQKKILQPHVEKGDINILHEQHLMSWTSIEAFSSVQNVLEREGDEIDVVLASNDLIAEGVIVGLDMYTDDWNVFITGQDGFLPACRRIMEERQTMTIYKSIPTLAKKAARTAELILNNLEVDFFSGTTNNGLVNVPSVLLEPVVVDKHNMKETVIADGFIKKEDLF